MFRLHLRYVYVFVVIELSNQPDKNEIVWMELMKKSCRNIRPSILGMYTCLVEIIELSNQPDMNELQNL